MGLQHIFLGGHNSTHNRDREGKGPRLPMIFLHDQTPPRLPPILVALGPEWGLSHSPPSSHPLLDTRVPNHARDKMVFKPYTDLLSTKPSSLLKPGLRRPRAPSMLRVPWVIFLGSGPAPHGASTAMVSHPLMMLMCSQSCKSLLWASAL